MRSLIRAAAAQRSLRLTVLEVPKVFRLVEVASSLVLLSALDNAASVVVFLVEREVAVLSSWVAVLHATLMESSLSPPALISRSVSFYAADTEQQAAATADSSASEGLEDGQCPRK